MSDILGKRLLKSLLKEETFSVLNKYGITRNDFFEDGKKAFEWIKEYWKTKGSLPTIKMLEESIGVFFSDETDDLDYICNQVRKRALGKKLERDLTEAAKKLESRDPDGALEVIRNLAKVQKVGELSSYKSDGLKRIEIYEKIKESGGLFGIRTPWKTLDNQIQGWVDGTLNVLTGYYSSGKSWCLVICAADCLNKGKKILFVTMEMDVYRVQRRLDSIIHKIPFGDLRDSSLDMISEKRWKDALTTGIEGDGDILIADKKVVERVDDVTTLVYENKPDIVFIDGGYRFKGRGTSHWESTVNIVGDLQLAAEVTNVPWVVTTQQGDARETGKEKKRGSKINAWGVRYGKEWIINPDVVLGLYQNKDLRLKHQLEIHILKMREIDGEYREPVFKIWWDRTKMYFDEVVEDFEDLKEEIGLDSKVEF